MKKLIMIVAGISCLYGCRANHLSQNELSSQQNNEEDPVWTDEGFRGNTLKGKVAIGEFTELPKTKGPAIKYMTSYNRHHYISKIKCETSICRQKVEELKLGDKILIVMTKFGPKIEKVKDLNLIKVSSYQGNEKRLRFGTELEIHSKEPVVLFTQSYNQIKYLLKGDVKKVFAIFTTGYRGDANEFYGIMNAFYGIGEKRLDAYSWGRGTWNVYKEYRRPTIDREAGVYYSNDRTLWGAGMEDIFGVKDDEFKKIKFYGWGYSLKEKYKANFVPLPPLF